MTFSATCALAGFSSSSSSMSSSLVRPITCSCSVTDSESQAAMSCRYFCTCTWREPAKSGILVADRCRATARGPSGSRFRRRIRAGRGCRRTGNRAPRRRRSPRRPSLEHAVASSKQTSSVSARTWNNRSPGVAGAACRGPPARRTDAARPAAARRTTGPRPASRSRRPPTNASPGRGTDRAHQPGDVRQRIVHSRLRRPCRW